MNKYPSTREPQKSEPGPISSQKSEPGPISSHSAVVEAVLRAGADPNAVGETGMTALMMAAFFGNPSIIQILIQHGARIDLVEERHKNTALLIAVRKGHAEAIRTLVKAGADPNHGSGWGDAPLCRAQFTGRPDIEAILVQSGAKCPSAEQVTR